MKEFRRKALEVLGTLNNLFEEREVCLRPGKDARGRQDACDPPGGIDVQILIRSSSVFGRY